VGKSQVSLRDQEDAGVTGAGEALGQKRRGWTSSRAVHRAPRSCSRFEYIVSAAGKALMVLNKSASCLLLLLYSFIYL
jgi:hypothetical protein